MLILDGTKEEREKKKTDATIKHPTKTLTLKFERRIFFKKKTQKNFTPILDLILKEPAPNTNTNVY